MYKKILFLLDIKVGNACLDTTHNFVGQPINNYWSIAISYEPYFCLIDFEAICVFVTHDTVKRIWLASTILEHIELLYDDNMLSNEILMGVMTMRGWELEVNLTLFDMSDFDVILDMNFSKNYRMEIEYQRKKV